VKIITANGSKKNKPVIITRNIKPQQVAALPGHQNGAKGNIETAEEKKIEGFPDPNQGLNY
jgi:hypothetical protein